MRRPKKWVDHLLGQHEIEPAGIAKPNGTNTGEATLTREEELALEGLLRESGLVIVGTLRRTDDSAADKMWAGHIDVVRVLLGNPSLKDVHVHFQHPTARRGAAPRETGQAGIWFVYGDGDFRQVVWPNQLRPIAFEKTLHPYLKRFLEEEINRLSKAGGDKNAARLAHLKANYQAVQVADPPSPPRAAADGQLTMQLSYAVSKPVPVPPAIAKLFREVVARPPARSLPESPFVAEWTALFRCDGDAYEWSGNVIGQRVGDEWRYWGCPRLAVLFHRMMEQRANTDEKLAAALDEFERDLKQGKIPAQDKKMLQVLETLRTVKRQLEQTVGGKWELQTTDEHPLAPVLVGQVEVADTGRTHLAAYVVLPFPYDGLGRQAVWGQYRAGSHTFSVLGANESLTVLGNMPSVSLPVSQDVMKTLGLTRPTITLEAMNTAEHLRRQREKLTVTLEWFGPGTGRLPAVRLTTPRAPAKAEPGWLVGQMSAFAARNLVDHFFEQGMLDPFDSANATPVRGPFCLMTIRAPAQPCSSEEVTLVNVLDWGQPLRKHLHAIREWLDGDARVAMDKLLEKLEKDEPPNTSTDPS